MSKRCKVRLTDVISNIPLTNISGIADGSNIPFIDILAINVRTEIAMGMMNDGCTTLGWRTSQGIVAGQNWDVSDLTPLPYDY